MWNLVYQPQAGLLNEVLYRVHGPMQGTDWLSSFTYAFPAVILVGVLGGYAADHDHPAGRAAGRSRTSCTRPRRRMRGNVSRRFRHITLPHMRGVIVAITSLDLVWNFNSFGLIYILTQGGPGGNTQVPAVFAYDAAFKYGQFGLWRCARRFHGRRDSRSS